MQGDVLGGYGIHAYKSPHGVLLDGYIERNSEFSWVIGEIALWGEVIEHEHGYRAEYGRAHSFVTWSKYSSEDLRSKLTTKYLTKKTFMLPPE